MFYSQYKKLSSMTLKKIKSDLVLKNATFLNVFSEEWIQADIAISDGYIVGIGSYEGEKEIDYSSKFLIPGFFDAHLHVESSMARPAYFFEKASLSGTTSFIIDPHEAANVSGISGIEYIIEESRLVDANVFVMAPSCVPATPLEDNGCTLNDQKLISLLKHKEVLGLAEVMDYPSLEQCNPLLINKLKAFEGYIKDGHSAGLVGREVSNFALSGINTDHEATTFEEAMELIRRGIHVHIREGSAARNLESIVKGIVENNLNTNHFSFCTDDKHMDDIEKHGHIVESVRKAIKLGISEIDAFKMASINTAKCYRLERIGAISVGYQADFLVLDQIKDFNILEVYIKGEKIQKKSYPFLLSQSDPLMNTVNIHDIKKEELKYPLQNTKTDVIGIIKHQILTNHLIEEVEIENGYFKPNTTYAKIAVVERHHASGKVGVGIVKGFNLKNCAIATSVGHDSHNITVVGDNDDDMYLAIKHIEKMQGGFVVVSNQKIEAQVDLRIMGIMSEKSESILTRQLTAMKQACIQCGVEEDLEVFLVLAFASLSVIPSLRITARGLYDVEKQTFI